MIDFPSGVLSGLILFCLGFTAIPVERLEASDELLRKNTEYQGLQAHHASGSLYVIVLDVGGQGGCRTETPKGVSGLGGIRSLSPFAEDNAAIDVTKAKA